MKVDLAKWVKLTTQTTPKAATHWSTRKMAAVLELSPSTVLRHWQANGLKPHLVRGLKVSRDPKLVENLEDIVGLYRYPGRWTQRVAISNNRLIELTSDKVSFHWKD